VPAAAAPAPAPSSNIANVMAGFDDAPPPAGRPVYGIEGALPAPRRPSTPAPVTAPPQDPRSRPPLPRRRPQEHLAAPLTQTASNPVDRVGEGLTPNLMADFRRGLALGATEPHGASDPHGTEPHSAIEPHRGGQPHEHPPNQEGH
jgi:hypothetical protein